jgi:hypothetical protein
LQGALAGALSSCLDIALIIYNVCVTSLNYFATRLSKAGQPRTLWCAKTKATLQCLKAFERRFDQMIEIGR